MTNIPTVCSPPIPAADGWEATCYYDRGGPLILVEFTKGTATTRSRLDTGKGWFIDPLPFELIEEVRERLISGIAQIMPIISTTRAKAIAEQLLESLPKNEVLQIVARIKGRDKLQAKDIPDLDVLIAVYRASLDGKWGWEGRVRWAFLSDMEEAFPNYSPKLVRAKMKAMIRKGLLRGCACGCRGDFQFTDKSKALVEAKLGHEIKVAE